MNSEQSSTFTDRLKPIDLVFAVAALAHLPMVMLYYRSVSVGHYQFAPLLIAVVAWLLVMRLKELPQRPGPRITTVAGLAAVFVLLLGAAITYSPFVWSGSAFVLTATFVFDRWGWVGLRHASPVGLLLLFAMPLPMNLDTAMIHRLQFLASRLASAILDTFSVVHFREGVVLVTEVKQYFTEEACSGIRSLFSSLAAISIYGVMNYYSIYRHVFNWVQTIGWVIVGNAIRIAAVVVLADNVDPSFAEGTPHQMIGLATFLLIFACAMSTDRALGAWRIARNNLLLDEVRTRKKSRIKSIRDQQGTEISGKLLPAWQRWAFIGLFLASGLLCYRMGVVLGSDKSFQEVLEEDFAVSRAEDLPKQLGGWTQTEFEHVYRGESRLLASESYIWTYTKNGLRAQLSLDGPYDDFHPLIICYQGLGWQVEQQHDYSSEAEPSSATESTTLTMDKPGEHGMVQFSALDRVGQLVPPGAGRDYWRFRTMMVRRNVMMALGVLDRDNDPRFSSQPLPISQLQLLYTSSTEIDENVKRELSQLFLAARETVRRSGRYTNSQNEQASAF